MEQLAYLAPLVGLLALLFAFYKACYINTLDAGTPKMREIAEAIAEGSMAFLKREYQFLFLFVVSVTVLLALSHWGEPALALQAVAFALGALCSALSGFFGMRVATKANVRTTQAAQKSLAQALQVAFSGGVVMGMSVVGLGLFGLGTLFVLLQHTTELFGQNPIQDILTILSGFSMGASSIALFAYNE